MLQCNQIVKLFQCSDFPGFASPVSQVNMLYNLSDRTQLELTGKDRAKFLHGFCTNDIKALAPGRGCEAFVCNIQGKTLGHIFVFCTDESLWLDSVPGQEDDLFQHLDRYLINEDVQIHRRTADRGDLYLAHSEWPTGLELSNCERLDGLRTAPVLSHVSVSYQGEPLQIRVVDWLGERGWLVSAPWAGLEVIAHELASAAGKKEGDFSAGEEWESRRIAAGFPLFGVDFTSDNLAQEVNRTERCISFHKGCYLGQEPIARIDSLGHVNRVCRRLTISASSRPAVGSVICDPMTKSQAGHLTSVSSRGNLPETWAALGIVKTKFARPGVNLDVVSEFAPGSATVV